MRENVTDAIASSNSNRRVALASVLAFMAMSAIDMFGPPLAARPQFGPQAPRTAAAEAAPIAVGTPRVVVTADPELDDSNSLVRYLLHSTDVVTEGLIYASSGVHWKGDGQGTRWYVPNREYTRSGLNLCPCESWRWAPEERFIDDAVDAYASVYDNLKVHDPDFPDPQMLKSKIRQGNVEFDGDISKDSDGSNLIAQLLLDQSEEPLYLLAWGGQSTIARALKSIQERHSQAPDWLAIRRRVARKAVIQSFGDQDSTHRAYISIHWPDVEWRQMATQTYGYGARSAVLPEDQVYLTAAWTREHISSRGPLGAFYRVWGDGRQMVKDDMFDYFGFSGLTADQLRARGYVVWAPVQESGSWISEGDTSTFMNLLDNGLRGFEHALYGGWGGRGAQDIGPNGPHAQYASARFFAAAQRDLAARFQWSVTPTYAGANHPPTVNVAGRLNRTARAGEAVALDGTASDPDGDAIAVRWWQYREAGTYPEALAITEPTALRTTVTIPADAAAGQTIHLILEVTDNGTPNLTRYRRIIITVVP